LSPRPASSRVSLAHCIGLQRTSLTVSLCCPTAVERQDLPHSCRSRPRSGSAHLGGERSFASTRRGDGVALMPDLPASHRLQAELRSPTQPLIPEEKASSTRDHFRIRFLHSYAQSFSIFDRLSPKNLASRCLDQRVWPVVGKLLREGRTRRSSSPLCSLAASWRQKLIANRSDR